MADPDLESAVGALKCMLSNTESVTLGNGINVNGEMYDDVKEGLEIALKLLTKMKVTR